MPAVGDDDAPGGQAGISRIEFTASLPAGPGVLKGVAGPFELAIPRAVTVDVVQEAERLEKELAKLGAEIVRIEQKLGNADFVARAPQAVVEENRARLAGLQDRRGKVEKNLAHLRQAS